MEAPAVDDKMGVGEGFMAKLHGIEGPMVVRLRLVPLGDVD